MAENKSINHTTRKDYIDTIKFLLILAIYIGHYGTSSGKLFPFVGGYHVRTFFLLSGFWALSKRETTISDYITNGLKKYMIPWGIWVVINTLFNAVFYSFGAGQSVEAFAIYFKSIRGSAIVGGMWFVPCFFLVSIIYHILQKMLFCLGNKSQLISSVLLLCISFVSQYLLRFVFPLPQDLIFSIHCIPEYLLCYALGAMVYTTYSLCKIPKLFKKIASFALVIIPIVYMAAFYFQKIDGLWHWVYRIPVNPMHLLPETVLLLMAYLFNRAIAKLITTKMTVAIGRCTLILCLSESVLKTSIGVFAQIFGLSINVTNPIQSLMFSALALVIGTYTTVPFTNKLTKQICDSLDSRTRV